MPEEYPIGAGFTEGELEFASFWVRHRVMMRRIVYGTLIFLNALFWGYAVWWVVDAYVISYPIESRIVEDIANNQFIASQLEGGRPASVQTKSVAMFEGTDGRLSMIVPIQNPNEEWYAEFTYRFNIGGEETPLKSGFVLPKQSSLLGEFGFAPKKSGSKSATLVVKTIQWKRADPSVIGDNYDEWLSRRDAFEFRDIEFVSDIPAGSKTVSRTTFTFKNPTAYGYWNLGLYVLAMRGSTPAAANYITLSEVKPGEERMVVTDWYERLSGITETTIMPVVNFFDDSAYLPSSRF